MRSRRGIPGLPVPQLLSLALLLDATVATFTLLQRPNAYAKVGAIVPSEVQQGAGTAPISALQSRKYLVATFPTMRQVAYCHLPDNVWRPLVVGDLTEPSGVAVDTQGARLFVADPPNQVIWWYQLGLSPNGLLQTIGDRHAAVEGVLAKWLAVNGVGDLYFTGKMASSAGNHSSVFRQDAANIMAGRSADPSEIYTRSNSGSPNAKVWAPSGVAVDALFVYWGNEAEGSSHGSVVKGSRTNIGLLSQDRQLRQLSKSVDEVTGVTATGTHIFYLSDSGVRGVLKSAATTVDDVSLGLVAVDPPKPTHPARLAAATKPWKPTSITWDGDNTLYFTDYANGVVYSLPALNIQQHNVTRYTVAPGVYGLAVVGFGGAK